MYKCVLLCVNSNYLYIITRKRMAKRGGVGVKESSSGKILR
jgi:hypothetical protein